MDNIMVRMGVVIGVLVAVQLGFVYVGHLAHPSVVEPQTPIQEFPSVVTLPEMGTWEGKEASLDARTFDASEVSAAVSRIYSKEGQILKFLLAEYREPSKGLYHNPMNCYRSNGYTMVGAAERQPLTARGRPDTKISMTTWERKGEKVLVAYWYEVGDYTMFERQDLLPTQWAMMGKTQWPVMFKVLLEMPAGDGDQSRTAILGMAQSLREWLGRDGIKPVVQ